jgi:dTDP-4-dehydrorhamnose reductase
MTKIAILGTSGMLGSTLSEEFSDKEFEIIKTTRKILEAQIASVDDISKVIESCDYVINCIGIIKPYIHDDNSFEVQRAIEVNGLFPHRLALAAQKTGSKVIQIATDCVFDGVKGKYLETDKHNALDVYGKTKSLGEVVAPNFLNLRCSIIGLEKKNYFSLLEWFLNQPKGAKVKGFKNHYWNGVTTNAFAKICIGIIRSGEFSNGLQHILASDSPSKAEMLHIFAKHFDREDIEIEDIDASMAIDRTLSTNNIQANDRIWKLAGYEKIPTVEEMIKGIK